LLARITDDANRVPDVAQRLTRKGEGFDIPVLARIKDQLISLHRDDTFVEETGYESAEMPGEGSCLELSGCSRHGGNFSIINFAVCSAGAGSAAGGAPTRSTCRHCFVELREPGE
jgi:hypothetical protein